MRNQKLILQLLLAVGSPPSSRDGRRANMVGPMRVNYQEDLNSQRFYPWTERSFRV